MARKRTPSPAKSKQVNVHFQMAFFERLSAAAHIQQHAEGQLVRILVEWALPFYERTRSVEVLQHLSMKHFTSLVDKPMEQQRREMDLAEEPMAVAAGGR